MASNNKYGNRGLYFDISNNSILPSSQVNPKDKKGNSNLAYFASQHEFEVFKLLHSTQMFCSVARQVKAELIAPYTVDIYPKGKTWLIDYAATTKDDRVFWIEAKGRILREFPYQLALLQLAQPEIFNNLWIVFQQKIPRSLTKTLKNNTNLSLRVTTIRGLPQRLEMMNIL